MAILVFNLVVLDINYCTFLNLLVIISLYSNYQFNYFLGVYCSNGLELSHHLIIVIFITFMSENTTLRSTIISLLLSKMLESLKLYPFTILSEKFGS